MEQRGHKLRLYPHRGGFGMVLERQNLPPAASFEGTDFDALVRDIRDFGLREPIILYDDQILDGRNRYRACLEAGVECRFETYTGSDPVAYTISVNVHRRHLGESQRAMVAAKLANLPRGRPAENAPIGAFSSQEDVAKMLNVARRSVQRAAFVRDHGIPELVALVERGEVAVSKAAEVANMSEGRQSATAPIGAVSQSAEAETASRQLTT